MRKKLLVVGLAFVGLLIVFTLLRGLNSGTKGKPTVYAVLPLTGALADVGNIYKNVIEMYLRENDASFAVKFVDSEYNPAKALSAVQQSSVMEDQPIIITAITAISTGIASGMHNGFVFSISTVETEKLSEFSNEQRISTTSVDGLPALAEYLARRKVKSVSIINPNNDYGLVAKTAFSSDCKSKGIAISTVETYSIQDVDMRDLVSKVVRLNTDAIFVTGAATPAFINIFKELRAKEYKGIVVGDEALGLPSVQRALKDELDGLVFPGFDVSLEAPFASKSKKFREKCIANNIVPDILSIETYDTMMVIDHIIKSNLSFSRDTFLDMKSFEGIAGDILFLEGGNCKYSFIPIKMSGNHMVLAE